MPVLGGGGVGRGRQLAAALALGCEGVWCGSVWLKTAQSECGPEIKQKFFAARSEDAVISKSQSGKTVRMLRSKWTEAWEKAGAPKPLPAPLQAFLWVGEGRPRIERSRAVDFMTYPVGQLVGDMREETSVKEVVYEMLNELLESSERLSAIIETE
jgi:NAD(P)H-dependent flavin oxidoreductase YrpB (nitropropane dioxygenase family)